MKKIFYYKNYLNNYKYDYQMNYKGYFYTDDIGSATFNFFFHHNDGYKCVSFGKRYRTISEKEIKDSNIL